MAIPKNPPHDKLHTWKDDGRRYRVAAHENVPTPGSRGMSLGLIDNLPPGVDAPRSGDDPTILSAADFGGSADIERLLRLGSIVQVLGPPPEVDVVHEEEADDDEEAPATLVAPPRSARRSRRPAVALGDPVDPVDAPVEGEAPIPNP